MPCCFFRGMMKLAGLKRHLVTCPDLPKGWTNACLPVGHVPYRLSADGDGKEDGVIELRPRGGRPVTGPTGRGSERPPGGPAENARATPKAAAAAQRLRGEASDWGEEEDRREFVEPMTSVRLSKRAAVAVAVSRDERSPKRAAARRRLRGTFAPGGGVGGRGGAVVGEDAAAGVAAAAVAVAVAVPIATRREGVSHPAERRFMCGYGCTRLNAPAVRVRQRAQEARDPRARHSG